MTDEAGDAAKASRRRRRLHCGRSGSASVCQSGSGAPKRFAIARPASSDSSTSEAASWQQIADDIASDLVASGRFTLIETDLSRQTASVDVPPDFSKWRSTGAEWLIVGRVTRPDDLLVVSFMLWDVANGQQMLNLYYRIDQEHLRLVPHLIAPAMIQHLSGEHGRPDANGQE
jgi:Tol biopolymer transport system component